jgi:hypothetical protein
MKGRALPGLFHVSGMIAAAMRALSTRSEGVYEARTTRRQALE